MTDFIHKPYNFEELDCVTLPEGRYYVRNENKYRSVTTLIHERLPQPRLEAWIKAVGQQKADQKKNAGAARGKEVHDLAEKHVLQYLSGIAPDLTAATPIGRRLFGQIKKMLEDHVKIVHNTEFCLYSNYLQTAGRCDLFAQWDEQHSIIDYKTATNGKDLEIIRGYEIQVSAYAMMVEELLQIPVNHYAIVIGVEDFAYYKGQLFQGDPHEHYDAVREIFRAK